ncbi:jg13002 [Pararge aegeria aegeria]|uniref:Jg13002 protein n=1 Tax=Pararge aegeria aegeria TaxID=348720 RepID=A0A8S4QW90_9NEOP|nr:jg13002 [Pararge aegeria aegeria]
MLFPSEVGERVAGGASYATSVDTIACLLRERRGVKVACDRDPLTPQLGPSLRWVLVGILGIRWRPRQGCLNAFPSVKQIQKKGYLKHLRSLMNRGLFSRERNVVGQGKMTFPRDARPESFA